MKRLIHLCQTLLLGAIIAGCGSGASFPGLSAPGTDLQTGQVVARKEGFSLRVLDESYRFGGSAELELDVVKSGTEVLVSVLADADDLRASYLELEYDAEKLHAVEARPGNWPIGDRELIHIALLNEEPVNGRATAHFGAVVPALDQQSGASGSFELLRLRFQQGAASTLRQSSKVPTAESSRIPDAAVDTSSGVVSFSYYNVGDYNQDGRVAVTDLTPIGIRFGDEVPENAPNSVEAVVDGTPDLRINVQDLTPIGLNFTAKVDQFNVYLGNDVDYNDPNNGAAILLGIVPFAPDGSDASVQRIGDPTQVRLAYQASYDQLINPDPALVWIRPVADQGGTNLELGIPSTPVAVQPGGPGGDVFPPAWATPANPGIISAVSHDGVVTVTWGAATDSTSPPVQYNLYFNEGGTVDFGSDSFLTFPEGTLQADVTGLTNGTQYAFAVRAQDSATPEPNEDKNTRTLLATPLATEDMPAIVDEDTTFTTPILLPESQTTEIENCAQLIFNHDLTIEGELKAVDCDLHITVLGKLVVNGKLTLQTTIANPEGSGTDAFSIKIEARSDVDFGPDSQLENAGNFYLVDNSAEFSEPIDVVNDTDTDVNPEVYDFALMNEAPPGPAGSPRQGRSLGYTFDGGAQTGPVVKRSSEALFHWNISGNWGQQPNTVPAVQRVVYRIYANTADIRFTDWSLIGPKGRNAADTVDCNAFGSAGGDAYRLRIHSAEDVSFDACNLGLSEGGRGGAANAPVCCEAFASAGQGGQPGRFRITSFTGISFEDSQSSLDPGKGGDGGPATAIGSAGLNGCNAEDGCQATAEGGDGADVYFGLLARGEIAGLSNLSVLPVKGGNGGSAVATGGDGGLNLCPCGGAGGGGGNAISTGGSGGDATFGSLAGALNGGATAGNGGTGTSTGGAGQPGGVCIKADEGGDGGDGGDATAVGGPAGTADGIEVPLTNGVEGSATAIGGNGANGGDGCFGGSAGTGGIANAIAEDATQTDGQVGTAGTDVCPVEWFVPLSSILPADSGPGPEIIPDGFSGNATLFDTGNLEVVGTVPFVWDVPVVGGAIWDEDLLTNDTYFQMNNSSSDQTISLEFDFSQVDLDNDTDPLGLLSSRLFIRDNRELTETTLGAYLDLRSTPDLSTLFLEPLDEVIHLPGDDSVIQEFDFGDVIADPIYRIACPPQWTTSIQLIYIVDP